MVVAQVVRIRNETLRTFAIQAGDPFYTPRIDGNSCSGPILVTPGWDEVIDRLVVPWETITSRGLEIAEVRDGVASEPLRCIVGPRRQDAENRDWLQYRTGNWEPLEEDRWLSLGPRHILGTVGGAADIQLTFVEPGHKETNTLSDLLDCIQFEHAVRCAEQNTVFVNVFDLASAMSIPNAMLCNTVFNTIGAFHAAVEVYGEEWSFYRTPNPNSCGVCKSVKPRQHPVHVYRQSINLGATSLKDWEVRYLIRAKLAQKWPGGSYDLLHRNCIHFCDELVLNLGVKAVPSWIRGLHETGAGVVRVLWPLSPLLGMSPAPSKMALTDGGAHDKDENTGASSVSTQTESGPATASRGGQSQDANAAAAAPRVEVITSRSSLPALHNLTSSAGTPSMAAASAAVGRRASA